MTDTMKRSKCAIDKNERKKQMFPAEKSTVRLGACERALLLSAAGCMHALLLTNTTSAAWEPALLRQSSTLGGLAEFGVRESCASAEAARLLGVSECYVRQLCRSGHLTTAPRRKGAPWKVYRDYL